ncbi:MAG: response regulator [Rubrivivax sp.]|nr:response regulator [Rubrivivax sp.]
MHKILLVEDNEMNREMLSRRLQRKGYEVVIAVDGLQGLAMAGTERPDLILMDMSLPGIDGWEATRRIKADAATRAIPVIALTAHAMSDDRAKALAAGCDEFDTKPVDLARLLGLMEALLNSDAQRATQAASPAPAPEVAQTASIALRASPASLHSFKAELEHFCMQTALDARVHDDLQVVLDEICANVFKHAYASGRPEEPGLLRLDMRVDRHSAPPLVELTFIDQGLPFDPLAQRAPDLSLSWQERPIGGLGIHLVQSLTDRQAYRHTAEEGNRLTLTKHLT